MRIQLKPIEPTDLIVIPNWVESYKEMVQWSGPWNFEFPITTEQLAGFFLTSTTPDRLRRAQFKAIDQETNAMVGQIGFSRIWDKTASGHMGPVIVAPENRGQGVGREMVDSLLRIGFEQYQLHRIELVVFSFNDAAISCYKNAGFQVEGLMRDIVRVGDDYWSWNVMSILESEWEESL